MSDYPPNRPYSNPRDQWVSDQLNRHSSGSWKHTPAGSTATTKLWLIAVFLFIGVMLAIASYAIPAFNSYVQAMNIHPGCNGIAGC